MYELIQPNYTEIIASELGLAAFQVDVVNELTLEWATVPFIARYRKERTGNLDENVIRQIIELKNKQENLFSAKQTAVNTIVELEKMTDDLFANIVNAKTLKEVEEIYKPYKSKKKTKAMIALEKGFWVVAEALKKNTVEIPESLLKDFSREEILDGAIEIVGAEVNANSNLRHRLIEELKKHGSISSAMKSEKMLEKLNEKDKEQISKFDIYKDFVVKVWYVKPYQILALNRGEKLGILNVKIEKDEMIFEKVLGSFQFSLKLKELIPELLEAFKRGFENLFSSTENELRSMLAEIGEDSSIATFQTNLKALLMTKPEKAKSILAIDPGFRVGCKLCVINEMGNPVAFDKIFLFEETKAKFKLKDLITTHGVDVVVIGNGTACKEVSALVSEIFSKDIFVVNESGASVYSVSKVAEEEFPSLDSLDRGTISIGRRYLDPLSELVKIPVGSIGVGMYQHDMPEKKLEQKLWYVVEDTVNEVGINVNTASIHVLNHISGIDKRQAKKIVDNKPYASRRDLKKVLSAKVFEQAVGFLRVPESEEILDNTDIHPDQYALAKYILENKISENTLNEEMKKLYPEVTKDTVVFILEAYKNLWVEKRKNSTHSRAGKNAPEAKEGDILEGVVRNVVAFWAFVDIGMKNDGLVHVSQLADMFVKNPMDIVKVGDRVKVKVTQIDEKGKIQLTMKWL